MTNAEWMIKNGYKFSDLLFSFDSSSGDIVISLYDKILVRGGYIPFDDFLKRWLDKDCKDHEEEPILNNAEKKYLSTVIKPFRDKVNFICKVNYYNNPEVDVYKAQHIVIGLNDNSPEVALPLFKAETMYKGMVAGHVYILEDLGL